MGGTCPCRAFPRSWPAPAGRRCDRAEARFLRLDAAATHGMAMFGFGKTAKDPLADAKSAERWLASFPTNDPLAIHAELLSELARLTQPDARRTIAQLEAVFALDAGTHELRRTLTAQYIEHANRSSRIENQLWSALFDLTQAFLIAYQSFGREATAHGAPHKWQAAMPELLARQIVHHGQDAK